MQRLDVACVGEVLWRYAVDAAPVAPGMIGAGRIDAGRIGVGTSDAGTKLLSFGGAPWAALVLAKRRLRVGLATTLPSDATGLRLRDLLSASGVDLGGVVFSGAAPRLVVLDRTGEAHVRADVDAIGAGLEVPPEWAPRVLFVSGLSPLVSRAAALCKAARAARRQGAIVVVDVNARWQLWLGQDPRAVQSILREADVVRLTAADLATLGLDVDAIRAQMRPSAVLFMSRGADEAWVSGPFGQVAKRSEHPVVLTTPLEPDLYAAVICDEIARAGTLSEDRGDLWARALERGYAAVQAQVKGLSR